MTEIRVNLLPKEVVEKQRQSRGVTLLNRLSIGVLLVVAFFASITLSVRFLQSLNLKNASENLALAQSKVDQLNERESRLGLIKEYLKSYNSLATADEKKRAVFSLVAFLAPSDVQFSDITIGRDGSTLISASTTTLGSIDKLLSDLTDKTKNADLIAKVDVDGLSLGKDFVYRFSLKITMK